MGRVPRLIGHLHFWTARHLRIARHLRMAHLRMAHLWIAHLRITHLWMAHFRIVPLRRGPLLGLHHSIVPSVCMAFRVIVALSSIIYLAIFFAVRTVTIWKSPKSRAIVTYLVWCRGREHYVLVCRYTMMSSIESAWVTCRKCCVPLGGRIAVWS